MASIDTRPVHVKALSWLGIALVCSPISFLAYVGLDRLNPANATRPSAAAVLFSLVAIAALVSLLVALAAQVANPRFDMRRPDFGEFLKGLVLGPAWLVCAVVAVALTAFFVTALIRFVFAVA